MVRRAGILDFDNFRGFQYYWHMQQHHAHQVFFPALWHAAISVPAMRVIHYPFDRIVHAFTIKNSSPKNLLSLKAIIRQTNTSQMFSTLYPSASVTILSLAINEYAQCMTGVSWKKAGYDTEFNSLTEFASYAFLGGALSGFFSTLICYPIELSKRMLLVDECNRKSYTSISSCTEQRYFGGGRPALYHGLSFSLFSASVFRSLLYGGYETCKLVLSPGDRACPTSDRVLSGYTASLCSLLVCHPLETTRLAIATNVYESVLNVGRVTLASVIKSHFKSANLMRGVSLVPVKAIPVSAVLIVYDSYISNTWRRRSPFT